MPSGKGKNPSDAATLPARSRPWLPAFMMASSTESTRLICPKPMPTVASARASTMALLLPCLQTFQAISSAVRVAGSGSSPATTSQSASSGNPSSSSCHRRSEPQARVRPAVVRAKRCGSTVSTRTFFLRVSLARASPL